MFPANWIKNAEERLAGKVSQTPVTFDRKVNAYIKWENKQRTGSFKIRGALNRILQLTPEEIQHGIVTASTGNHGLAAALAGQEAGIEVKVFIPAASAAEKIAGIKRCGAEVMPVEGKYADAEKTALSFAAKEGAIWISPDNDGVVIAGQGTLGAELARQIDLDEVDQVVVPVGGGGLAAGVGAAFESLPKRPKLIGVQAQASPYFFAILRSGVQEELPESPTLADGLAGAVEKGSITIPLVKHYLDDILLVSEDEIGQAMVYAWETWNEKVEGAAAVTLAAALNGRLGSRKSVLIFSGGNVDAATFAQVQEKWAGKSRQISGIE